MYSKPPQKKGTKRSVQQVSRPDPAVEALFAKVPKSAAASITPDSSSPAPKRNAIRHRIAMAHAYGKKESDSQRVELFIPNLPFANKFIHDKALKDEVESVLSEADKEIHHEIELARRYAFGDSSDGEDQKRGSQSADALTTASLPPVMDAASAAVFPSGGLVAPAPAEGSGQLAASKSTTVAKALGDKKAPPSVKKDSLFGQKAKPKKSFMLDNSPAPKAAPAKSKKTKDPRQVVFNENVIVDEISLVGADEASITSSITHDDSSLTDFEILPTTIAEGGLSTDERRVMLSGAADKQPTPVKAASPRHEPVAKVETLIHAVSPIGKTVSEKHTSHKEVEETASKLKPAESPPVRSERRPSTVVPLKGGPEEEEIKSKIVPKPASAPHDQPLTELKKKINAPPISKPHTRTTVERPEETEKNDAIKFLSLLDQQAQVTRLLQQDRPKTALPRKVPAYVEKIQRAVRPKTAPESAAVLSADEEEEYGNFLSLLENYAGELVPVDPAASTVSKSEKSIRSVVDSLPLSEQKGLPTELRPKSSGRSRTPILLSPRSQAAIDKPPKSPSPRAFEVLDLPEPIMVPFPLVDLYSMPAQDIEVLVPKTQGQLRLQIRHDDEGDIHGLFVHGFRANCKAEELGLIKVGDELLKVNDVVVKGGYLEDVVAALRFHDDDVVPMVVRRHLVPSIDQSPTEFNYDPQIVGNYDESPRPFAVSNQPFTDVDDFPSLYELFTLPAHDIEISVPKTNGQLRIQLRHDDEGDVHGLFVHGFRPFSKAEEQGLIKVADEIIKVDGKIVKGGYLEDVVEILKDHSAETVPIVVRRYSAEPRPGSRGSQLEHYGRGDDISPRPFEVTNFVGTSVSFPPLGVLFKLPSKDIKIMVPKTNGQLRIQLRHDDEGDLHGLFIHGFRPFSKAEEEGKLKVGDEVFKVNGVFVKGGYLEDVVAALEDHEEDTVEFVVRRHFQKKEIAW